MTDLTFSHAARSETGFVRTQNEDAWLVVPEAGLFAVADGLGGHSAGEVASRLAVETVAEHLRGTESEGDLAGAVRDANRAIRDRAARAPRLAGMGTTLTLLQLAPAGEYRIAHVGDSRAYLLREGALRRLTTDHTLVQEIVNQGRLTDEEARLHPGSHVLTRALGIEAEVDVEESRGQVGPGDRFLLATDGLTGLVAEDRILAMLESASSPEEAVDLLVGEALRAGGTDNVTVLVIDVAG